MRNKAEPLLSVRVSVLNSALLLLMVTDPIASQAAALVNAAESRAVSHFELAEKLANTNQYVQAISEYKLALQEAPNDEAALCGLAVAQAKAGQNPDAIQSYLTVLKVNPKLWEAEVNLGILLLGQQNTSEALTHFQNAQSLNPNNFRVRYYTARSQELTGDLAHAETSYLQALGLAQEDSDKFEINASLGSLYLKKKSWPEAEKHLLAARQFPGETVTVDLELAQLYYETGQPEKALDLLKSINKSDDPEIHEL